MREKYAAMVFLRIIDLKDYISYYYDFEHVIDVFEKLEKREIAKNVLLYFNEE